MLMFDAIFVNQVSISGKISRVLVKIGISSACTNKRNLGTLLRNNKPKLGIGHKSGAYKKVVRIVKHSTYGRLAGI